MYCADESREKLNQQSGDAGQGGERLVGDGHEAEGRAVCRRGGGHASAAAKVQALQDAQIQQAQEACCQDVGSYQVSKLPASSSLTYKLES